MSRICPVIYLLDTSRSMEGEPIALLNEAIQSILSHLKRMEERDEYTKIKVGILTFSSDVHWITGNGLCSIDDFGWEPLTADGSTSMGAAFHDLNKKLSEPTGFMPQPNETTSPVLLLMSDGIPSDDYQSELRLLQKNKWYKKSIRVAVGYGACDDSVLYEFTEREDAIVHTDTAEELENIISSLTVTSVQVSCARKNVSVLSSMIESADESFS